MAKKKRKVSFSEDCEFTNSGDDTSLNDLLTELFVEFVNEKEENTEKIIKNIS